MKQIRQYLKDGRLEAGDVPLPAVGPGDVLIRSHYSFVSVGTEKMKVTQARMNLAEKARERPDQVRQVIQTLREQGLGATLRKVNERLRSPVTLGYSCAGTVAQVGARVDEFRAGDRVAAIGEGLATHAEYNAVPRNLVVAVPPAVAHQLRGELDRLVAVRRGRDEHCVDAEPGGEAQRVRERLVALRRAGGLGAVLPRELALRRVEIHAHHAAAVRTRELDQELAEQAEPDHRDRLAELEPRLAH